jgi:hypothetical protein
MSTEQHTLAVIIPILLCQIFDTARLGWLVWSIHAGVEPERAGSASLMRAVRRNQMFFYHVMSWITIMACDEQEQTKIGHLHREYIT